MYVSYLPLVKPVTVFQVIAYVCSTTILILKDETYGVVKILMAHMHIAWQTPRIKHLSHTTTTHNTQTKKHKTRSPWSPQATGFQRLQFYRWVQPPYVAQSIMIIATRRCTFIDNTNCCFIYLTIILCAAAQRAH